MKLFGYDTPLMQGINSIAETVTMGILWLVCSLPVVTIGASTAALCQVTVNSQYGEKKNMMAFFSAFKQHFGKATLLWLLLAAAMALLGGALYGVLQLQSDLLRGLLAVAVLTLLYVVLVIGIYGFPFAAYYERLEGGLSLAELLRISVTIGASNPFRALPFVLVMLIPVALLLFLPLIFIYLTPFWLVMWPAILIQWITGRLVKQFGQYEFEAGE